MRTTEPAIRILLVEDESGHAELICRAFEGTEKAYDVAVATTVAEARQLASRHLPHIALVDYRLPDGQGDAMIELGKDIFPVVMLTSHGDEQLAVKAIKAGALDYVAKSPELFSSLPHVVERALREWQTLRDQKKAEAALRKSEDQFKELFEDAPVGYHEIDDHGVIVRINNTELQMLGYAREEVLGKQVWTLSSDPELSRIAVFQKLSGSVDRIKPFERTFLCKGGKTLPILIEDRIIRRDDGSAVGIRSIVQDISVLKQAEEALHHSEVKFRNIWDNSADGMRLTDREGRIVDVNEAFCKLVQLPREKLLGKSLSVAYELRGPDDDLKAYHKRFDAGEIFTSHFGKAMLWNGVKIYLDVSSSFIEPDGHQRLLLCLFRDVTGRRQTEDSLRESEAHFRALFENASDGIVYLTMDLDFLSVNESFARMHGYSSEEMRTMRLQDLDVEDLSDQNPDRMRRITAGEDIRFDVRHRHRDGHVIDLEVATCKVTLQNETVLVAFHRDITERKRAQEALRQSGIYLRGTLDSTGDGILSVDAKGKIINANHRFIEMWRIPDSLSQGDNDDALLAYVLDQLIDPEAFLDKVRTLYQTDRIDDDVLYFKDGRIFERHSRPLVLEDSIVGRVWSFRDMTDRMRAEEAVRESEQNYRTLADSGRALIWASGTDKLCNYFNRTWLEFTGRTREQEIGNGWVEGVHPDDLERCLDIYVSSFDKRIPFSMEYRLRHNDGEFRWVQDDGNPRYDSKGVFIGYIGHCLDITDRKQAELARKSTEEALRHAQKLESIGTLAGGIAHDFNNLLNAIMGQSSLALEKLSEDNPAAEHLTKSIRAAERAADLTRQLLAYSGKGKFITQEFDLNIMVEDNSQLLSVSVPKTARVRCETSDTPLYIRGDPGQIQQVIMNLIINAGESMESRPGMITIRTLTHLLTSNDYRYWKYTNQPLAPGDYALLQVEDVGCGMEADVLARIFDPFFTTKFTGRGLGLAAVLGIVRSHLGGIHITSEPGKGSLFEIVLPTANARIHDLTSELPRNRLTNGAGKSVLLIDDEPFVLELLTDMFTDAHFTVIATMDPAEGIELYRRHHKEIAVVILDYSMPGMDGKETFRRLLEINSGAKVMLCSGYAATEVESAFGDVRPIGFIHKPYKPSELLDRILKLL